jgi:hypothetical protein
VRTDYETTLLTSRLVLVAACSLLALHGGEVEGLDGKLRLNEVQYIGTHNSYHIAPGDAVALEMLRSGYAQSKEWPAARLIEATDYTHPALSIQLRLGLRLFELDVHDDPEGGRFPTRDFFDSRGKVHCACRSESARWTSSSNPASRSCTTASGIFGAPITC